MIFEVYEVLESNRMNYAKICRLRSENDAICLSLTLSFARFLSILSKYTRDVYRTKM